MELPPRRDPQHAEGPIPRAPTPGAPTPGAQTPGTQTPETLTPGPSAAVEPPVPATANAPACVSTGAPALAAAGALVLGCGAQALLHGASQQGATFRGIGTGAAPGIFVVCLGLLALKAAAVTRSPRAVLLWLLALAALAALRSGDAAPARGPLPPQTGQLTQPWHSAGAGPGSERWEMMSPAGSSGVVAPAGTVRAGETVRVLGTANRRERARAPGLSRTTERRLARPLPPEPLADELQRLGPPAGTQAEGVGARGLFEQLRRRGVEATRSHPNEDTAGLLAALLFGETSDLPHGARDLFTRTGTRHMLALSGLHVGLLGVLIAGPLARGIARLLGLIGACLGRPWRPSPAVPLAVLAVMFIPLAGCGAPASRAAVALALAALGPRLHSGARRPLGANLLGVALTIEMLLDPRAAVRPGVQLSYLATAALIAAGPATARRLTARFPGRCRISPVGRTGRRRWPLGVAAAQKILVGISTGVAASIVASLATLPTAWTSFGEWSPVGILATPIALLPVIGLVAGGWIWLATGAVFTERFGDDALDWTARSLFWILDGADRAPWSPLALPERPHLWLAAAAFAGLLACRHPSPRAARRRLRLCAFGFAVALFPFCFGVAAPGAQAMLPRAAALTVHVLDVGNGTSVLVRAPDEPPLLFDAGSRDRVGVAQSAVGPLLRALDVGRLRIVLSHDHADHARALPWIARRWPPLDWVGPRATTREGIHRAGGRETGLLGPDILSGARHRLVQPGATQVFGGNTGLRVFALRGGHFEKNEGSLMIDVRFSGTRGQGRVILCGDAEGHGLAALLSAEGGQPLLSPGPVDALLLPHHGSSSRHLGWLLDHLRPREVWISATETPNGASAECTRRGIRLRTTGATGPFIWSLRGPQE